MTMHPELQRTINLNTSALEMIKAFTKHHSGVRAGDIGLSHSFEIEKRCHNESSFWDTWTPVLGDVGRSKDPSAAPASEAFLSIHKGLTRDIISWICDSKRRSHVYLIAESQTPTLDFNNSFRATAFATMCYDAHRFGLTLRDPHGGGSNISSLCFALAAYYPLFRRILAQGLIDYSNNAALPQRAYLKKLILGPWKALAGSHPHYTTAPPVIVLRWEYESDIELFRAICELASSPVASPLLWIVSFHPKFALHIQDYLDPLSIQFARVPICYNDAHADTELYVRHHFSILHQKHKETFDEEEVWPSEEQMSHLTRIFSGAFDSFDVVNRYVDWEGDGGPKAHLETFLAYMIDSPSPSEEQPYCALDHFYTRAFAAIPPHILSVVTRLLGVFYCVDSIELFTLFQLAGLFSLPHDTVLDVLPRFCRWAVTPSMINEDLYYGRCLFFVGFLKCANRSGHFYIRAQRSEIRDVTYHACLHVTSQLPHLITSMKPVGLFDPKRLPVEIMRVQFIVVVLFYRCARSNFDESPSQWMLLCGFDFRCLAHIDTGVATMLIFPFLIKLHAWGENSSPNIFRVEPAGILDRKFIDKCEGNAEPLDLNKDGDWSELSEWCPAGPKYVLLGLEAGMVLVLLHATKHPWSSEDRCGYTIYTSDMLDYM